MKMMKDFLLYSFEKGNVDWERTTKLRQRMEKRMATICAQRAVFYTESFRLTENEPYCIRKAKAFAYMLEHMDIYIEEDSLIFGNQASQNFAAPIFPEYSIQWVLDELDSFDQREGDVFFIRDEVKTQLRNIAPYWIGKTHEDEVNRNLNDSIRLAEKQGVLHRGGISMSGDGHIVPDHEMLLKRGLRSIVDEAMILREEEGKTQEQIEFYTSVILSLEGVLHFFKRYAKLALQLSKEASGTRKQELIEIANMAETLMEQPARSFYEGVEACYMVHMLQMMESNGHSFCYGRFDQYMYELYQQDIEKGILTKEKALEIITHMFLMNSSHNKVRPYGHTRFSQGYPLYSNLVVGGLKPNGEDGTNELSYLCIEAMNLTALAEPNFSARYHQNSPREFVRACAKLIRTGCGMPSMFNDEIVAKGIEDLGISKEDALDYCPIGCVETGVPGKYGHRATGMTYVNWGKVLEIMLYHGVDPATEINMMPIAFGKQKDTDYKTYDELWEAWNQYLTFYSDISVECDAICDASLAVYDADPFASCLIQNSMKLGKTLKNGGCKYDVISQSNIGPSVVGNALYAIKTLVYEKHDITLKELRLAMKDNWQSDTSKRIHKKIRKTAKFGNDEDDVDKIVSDVFYSYLNLLPTYKTIRHNKGPEVSCYTMSTSNITSYVPNGMAVGATPDGRYAGTALNEGCSPTQGTDIKGPTAVINSVAKLPNEKVAAGQLLNMRFSPATLEGDDKLENFVNFLYVSAQKGIYHNQFNVIESTILKEAQKNPENYTDLIVRVAGYCAQFISLMPEAQNAIIARTQNHL